MTLDPSTLGDFRAGVSDYFGNQLFTDTGLTTACADGDPIAGLDIYGSGANFLQSTLANRPIARKGSNGLNGHDVLNPDGSNDFLLGGALSSYITASRYTVLCLFNPTTIVKNQSGVYFNDPIYSTDTAAYFGGYLRNNSGTYEAYGYHEDGNPRSAKAAVAPALTTWQASAHTYDGTNIRMRLGSGAWVTQAAGSVGSLANNLRFFNNGFTGLPVFNGKLATWLCYGSLLTDTMIDRIFAEFVEPYYAVSVWTRFSPASQTHRPDGSISRAPFLEIPFMSPPRDTVTSTVATKLHRFELASSATTTNPPAVTSDVATKLHRLETAASVTNTPAPAVTSTVATKLHRLETAADVTTTNAPAVTSDVATKLHRLELASTVTTTDAPAVTSVVDTRLHRLELAADVTNTPAPAVTSVVDTRLHRLELASVVTQGAPPAVLTTVDTRLHRLETAADVTNTPAPAITGTVATKLHRLELASVVTTVNAPAVTSVVDTRLHKLTLAASITNTAPGAIVAQVATRLHRLELASVVTADQSITGTVATRLHKLTLASEVFADQSITGYVDTRLHRLQTDARVRVPIATLPVTGVCVISDELACITCVTDVLATGECSVSDALACFACVSEHDVAGETSVSDELSNVECLSDNQLLT